MTTFSQIVDDLADVELKRPDLRQTLAGFLRQTLLEVHSKRDGSPIFYGENRNEDEITATAAPHIWAIPTPQYTFQQMEAVYYPNYGVYAKEKTPKTIFATLSDPEARFNFYRSGANFIMNGILIGDLIKISWFTRPPSLNYYTPATRPAVWDIETQDYTILGSWSGTAQEAVDASTNWLIARYGEQLKEGVRSMYYRRVNNEEQAKMSYSAFEFLKSTLALQEGA